MEGEIVSEFFLAVEGDCRISTRHISLYMSLLAFRNKSDRAASFAINRCAVMKAAKISGVATYHKCIRDLHKYGYISYLPSHNHLVQTRVALVQLV